MRRRPPIVRLVSELAIIFAGVYGAFWVERYRGQVEDRERAITILEALEAELENLTTFGPVVVDSMTAVLDAFETATAAGQRPPPAFYREPNAETPSISVWKATLSSGGVNLLDPDLFFRAAAVYNLIESASQRYLRYNAVTESELLPRLSLGPEAFYDPGTGRMDPLFVVHMDLLRTLRDEVAFSVERSRALIQAIQEELERLR